MLSWREGRFQADWKLSRSRRSLGWRIPRQEAQIRMTPLRYAVLKVGTAHRATRDSRGDFDRMVVDTLA